MSGKGRLIVVSNRLPFKVEVENHGLTLQPSNGGLVTALVPILRQNGGCWIGWTGASYDAEPAESVRALCSSQSTPLEPVFLTAPETAGYYRGFANETIWPLFHGFVSRSHAGANSWDVYCQVNRKFAKAVVDVAGDEDLIWIHDYHLMMLADALRASGLRQRLAYFHHIPFPPVEVFKKLPRPLEVLRALTRFNDIGFQTDRDRSNFITCLRHYLSDIRVSGTGPRLAIRAGSEFATVGVYPISIDYEEFVTEAAMPSVAAASESIRKRFGTPIVLGIDRLDYTKGIPERLNAFQTLLESNPELHGKVTMVQIVIPSREDIREYEELKLRIETLVSSINGQYGRTGWVPVHYLYRSIPRSELVAFYRAANVALVTPLKDGMNLIAKEFCASRIDNEGVLVLSEFAGAAEELKHGALLVNPRDTENVASVLRWALQMTRSRQRTRMQIMRSQIRAHDVFHWARRFTSENAAFGLDTTPSPVTWTPERRRVAI